MEDFPPQHQKKTIFKVIRNDFFQDNLNPPNGANTPAANNITSAQPVQNIPEQLSNSNIQPIFQSPIVQIPKKDVHYPQQIPPRQKSIAVRSPKKNEISYLIKDYLLYLKNQQSEYQNNTKKDFEDYNKNFPEWENYEFILILAISDLNDNFDKFTSYINLYLYENLKKLRDPKNIKELITNSTVNETHLQTECLKFYTYKQQEFLNIVGKELNISECYNMLVATALTFQKIKGIEELDLTQYLINGVYIQPVISAIKFNEHIQRLFLANNPIGDEGCYWLGTMLRNNKHVCEIDISNCKITNRCLRMINEGLKNPMMVNSYYLKKINLASNELNENGGTEIARFLGNFGYLQWLNLCKNKLKNAGFRMLMEKYEELINVGRTNLDTLIIFNNDIREEDSLEVLGRVVENSRCTLKCLVLSENDLSSSNLPNGYLSYFFNSLKRNTSLVEILMLNCNIRNDNVDDICNMLTENKKLEKLCLYNNMIDNPTKFLKILSVFCGPNPRNNTLKELDLSKNKCKLSINDEFLKIIKNLQIDSLDISQNFELTNTADAEKFRKVASDVQNKIKIIFS